MSKFIDYMKKEAAAGLVANLVEETGENLVGIIPYLIGVPLIGGSAAGYLASRMSSPSDSDVQALQERVMDTKVREELGVQQRRLAALKQRLKEKKKADQERAKLSRKRDPFV
jgi:hypothetical protein